VKFNHGERYTTNVVNQGQTVSIADNSLSD